MRYMIYIVSCLCWSLVGLSGMAPASDVHKLPYLGRLLDGDGRPVTGPVDLQVSFHAAASDAEDHDRAPKSGAVGSRETASDSWLLKPRMLAKVPLQDGVFEIEIVLTAEEYERVFGSKNPVYLQITDLTHARVYNRTRYAPPSAKVARQPESAPATHAVATTEAPSGMSALTVAASAACLASPVAGAKFLITNDNKGAACASACGAARAEASCLRGWTTYADGRYFDYGNECQVNTPAGPQDFQSRLCCCVSLAGPDTLLPGGSLSTIAH